MENFQIAYEQTTNMLQFEIPQSRMMKYCGIPRRISPNTPLPLYRIKQFLAAGAKTIKISCQSRVLKSRLISNKNNKVIG